MGMSGAGRCATCCRSIEAEEMGVGRAPRIELDPGRGGMVPPRPGSNSRASALIHARRSGVKSLGRFANGWRPLMVAIRPIRVCAARSKWCGVRIHGRRGRQHGRLVRIPEAARVMGNAAGQWW